MSKDSTTLNIQKREDKQWELKRRGSRRASSVCKTKSEAVKEGKRYLEEYDNAKELIIFKSDGEVDKIVKAPKKSKRPSKLETVKEEILNDNFKLSYTAWPEKYLPEKPLKQSDQGARVHVAGEKATEKAYLNAVHKSGDSGWPKGGYEVRWRNKDYITNHFYNEIILHKSEKKKRLSKNRK